MPKRKSPSRRENEPHSLAHAGTSTRAFWLTALLVSLAVLGVYGQSLDAPFVFDDYTAIVTNRSIVALWPLVGDETNPGPLNPPAHLPTSARPIVNLSFALNYSLGRLEPVGYRAVNVILHIFSTLLLWALVRRTLQLPRLLIPDPQARWLASAVALLWALHPLQTEAVIYITQRTELMMALFYLATMYCSMRYWMGRTPAARAMWLFLAVFACAAGMLSKEVMVSAPLVVLLYERTFVAGSLKKALRESWRLYSGLFGTWAILLFYHLGNPHGDVAGFGVNVSLWSWWLTQAKVFLLYLKLALWPWPLQIHYELPLFRSLAEAWPYVLIVAIVVCATLVLLWRNHPVGFLGAYVFVILAPTSLVPILTEIAAERRMYLPLAAMVALAVVGGYVVAEPMLNRLGLARRTGRNYRTPLGRTGAPVLLAVIAFGVGSAARSAAYQNPIELWLDVARRQPASHMAYQNVAGELARAGRTQEAVAWYRRAIQINPDSTPAHYRLGWVLFHSGRTDEAITEFRETVRQEPHVAEHRNNLAAAYVKANRLPEAIDQFREAIDLDPQMWLAHDNLGAALARLGRYDDAIAHYERALKINPQALHVYGHLADAYARTGKATEAMDAAERALAIARQRGNRTVAEKIRGQLEAFRRGRSDGAGTSGDAQLNSTGRGQH